MPKNATTLSVLFMMGASILAAPEVYALTTTFAWDAQADVTGYRLYRSVGVMCDTWDLRASTRGLTEKDTIAPVADTWYCYKLLPVTKDGEGIRSRYIRIYTPALLMVEESAEEYAQRRKNEKAPEGIAQPPQPDTEGLAAPEAAEPPSAGQEAGVIAAPAPEEPVVEKSHRKRQRTHERRQRREARIRAEKG